MKGWPEISTTYAFYEEHTAGTISSPWISIYSSLLADIYAYLSCNLTLKAKLKRSNASCAEQNKLSYKKFIIKKTLKRVPTLIWIESSC